MLMPVASLTPAQIDAMWRIFDRYYSEVSLAQFEADLREKQKVILLLDSGDRSLQGFSSLQMLEGVASGRPFRALFSGDTICEKGYWGSRVLNRRFALHLISEWFRAPSVPLYWFLISKGYKTYLLLTRNFPESWPRRGMEVPAFEREVLDALARRKFGDAWKPKLGILRFRTCQGRLRDDVAPLDAFILDDPDVRFFAERNPNHAQGDELCCLGKVGLRFFGTTLRKYLVPWARSRRSRSAAQGEDRSEAA